MADRTIRAIITGSSAGAVRAFEESALAAEKSSKAMGDHMEAGTARVGGAFSKLGALGASWGLPFHESLHKLGDHLTETESRGKKFGTAFADLGRSAALGLGGGLAIAGVEAVKLGMGLQESQDKLSVAVKNSGASMDQYKGQLDATRSRMESLGFTYEQTNDALANSVVSTQNVSKSMGTLGLAADLARFRHIDLADATTMVNKALEGQLRPLKALAIDLPVAATSALKLQTANDAVAKAQANVNAILAAVPGAANPASAAHTKYETAVNRLTLAQQKLQAGQATSNEIFNELTKRLGGSAAAAAETFAGKMDVLKAQAHDFGATVGVALIPKLSETVGWLSKNKEVAEVLAGVILTVLGAAVTTFAVTKVVEFGKGVGSMISGLSGLAAKMTTTASVVVAEDATIVGANAAAGASFTAMLGPIAAAGAGIAIVAIATDKLLRKIFDLKATSSLAPASEAYAKAHGGIDAIHDARVAKATGAGLPKGNDTPPTKLPPILDPTSAANFVSTAGNSLGKAHTTAMHSVASKLELAHKHALAAEATEDRSILRTGNVELNKLVAAEHSTSLAQLNLLLDKTHNKGLVNLEKVLGKEHENGMVSLEHQLVTAHKAALNNWLAQQRAASAAAELARSGALAQGIGLQQTVNEDRQALNGLSGDALAVGQAQLNLDEKKLEDANRSYQLQLALDSAVGAAARANAQAALDNFTSLATISEASLAAALSGASFQQGYNTNLRTIDPTSLIGLASGGIVNSPTVALIGESGPEAVVPLTGSGVGSAGGSGPIYLQIDGLTFAKLMFPHIQTAGLQRTRGVVNLGLT